MTMKYLLINCIVVLSFSLNSQEIVNIKELKPSEEYENIHVQKLSSDSLVSTFAIWIKLKVKSHKHTHHTEHVYIENGKGNFTIADSTFKIRAGDFIIIPKNTYHSLEVTSQKPIKALSIQAPLFIGEDRIFKKLELK